MSDLGSTAAQEALEAQYELPIIRIPRVPNPATFWWRVLVIVLIYVGYVLLDQLSYVILDFWLLESLGFEDVFWTNFRTGAVLFLIGVGGVGSGIILPALRTDIDRNLRRSIVLLGVLAGLWGGYLMAARFEDFLLLLYGGSFGQSDPVFGRDFGFYAFSLPALWVIWTAVFLSMLAGLFSSLICASNSQPSEATAGSRSRFVVWLAHVSTPFTLIPLAILGVTGAAGFWLLRYSLLWANNGDSMIWGGAEYVDVVGFFSTLNYYYVTSLVILGITGVIVYRLHALHRTRNAPASREWPRQLRTASVAVLALIGLDFGVRSVVQIRDAISVRPNEPVIQLPYIKRHIDATMTGFDLDKVEEVEFVPAEISEPIPDAAELVRHISLRNVPLWPGWVSYLERVVDPQQSDRILITGGDDMVYGPVIEIFRQQQKLRAYYDFMDIDTVRYKIDGETQMMVSSVRELPMNTEPWLYRWGQHALLYTHGYGLIMAPSGELSEAGEPLYVSKGIPTRAVYPELDVKNQAVYYGEGGGRFGTGSHTMAYSRARNINELDYPTDQGRAEVRLPDDADWGVPMDSWFKKLVIGWRQGVTINILFSDLIGSETLVHYYRTPLERAERIASFLYFGSNTFAFVNDGGISWMINGMTTTHYFPYSERHRLGDKSDERLFYNRDYRWANYVRDTVKVTLDAYTGKMRFYKIADEPIVDTWANIYPTLFTPGDEMPQNVRDHLQYPLQFFHIQFDNVYKRYHMRDPLTFFNVEDLWDDADEVIGPILDEGEAITFSMEPYLWVAETGNGVLPATENGTQFAMSMQFTNEKAWNLRAMPIVYQDGADYGRLVVLLVPKGHFFPGPEQADAAMDQDTDISQSINWWNRMGAEVIAGHTTPLVIGKELIYVAPLLIRSKQNNYPQIKRVIVVFRGHAADGFTLAEALENAIAKAAKDQRIKGLLVPTTSARENSGAGETVRENLVSPRTN